MARGRGPLRRAGLVLAVALALPLLPSPTGASAADPVAVAEAELAGLRAEVERTAAVLTAGTRELEEGRAELTRVQRELAAAQREAVAAQGRADAAVGRLQSLAAAAYRSPVPDGLVLALTGTPDGFLDAMVARADLDRVRGSSTAVLREATADRVTARGAALAVEQLTEEAAARSQALEAQVAELRAVAERTATELAAASARLEAARARVSRSSRGSVVATCSGAGSGGANGFLEPGALCGLAGAAGHALRSDAAAAFDRMSAAAAAERGEPLCVTDSYRSYAGQVDVFRRKPQLAAVPGTSRHGFGVAVDIGCGAERFGSSTYRWLEDNAGRFGWSHPAWAEPGGGMPEPWHWEWSG